jgi:tetratricopeptide (TPR) repeat protein
LLGYFTPHHRIWKKENETMARKSICLSVLLGTFVAGIILAASQLSAQESTGAAGTPPTSPPADSVQMPEIKDAVAKFSQRDFAGALKLIKEAVKKNPDLPPAQVIMAQLFGQAKQAAAVRRALENAVVDAPADPEAYVILGDFALRERRVTEAGLLFNKAGDLLAKFKGSEKRKKLLEPRIFAGLAAIAEARGDWAEAQKQTEAWLKVDKDSAVAMQRLALAMFKQKKATPAYEMLKKAAVANPKVLTPAATLATFYQQAGDVKNATIWMKYAVEKAAPKDLRTHLLATQWALETDQLDMAKKLAGESMDIDPKSLPAKVLRGVVDLFQGNYKNAEMYFEAAHLQSPSSFAATNNLALALVEQDDEGKNRKALEYATANVRARPRNTEAASTYGWVLYKMGQLKEANTILQKVMSVGNPSPDSMYFFARVLLDQDRKEDAKKLLDFAVKSKQPFSKRRQAKKLVKELQ